MNLLLGVYKLYNFYTFCNSAKNMSENIIWSYDKYKKINYFYNNYKVKNTFNFRNEKDWVVVY